VKTLLDALVVKLELRKVRSLKSIKSYVAHIDHAFGQRKAVEITDEAIAQHVADRVKLGHAPSSINHSLQVFAQALRPFLAKARHPMPTIERLPEDNARETFYSKAQADALIAALPADLQDFTRFGWLTGWRKGGITSLQWTDVDRDTRSIRLSWRASKTKTARTMALEGDLAAIIERRWHARQITLKNGTTLLSPLVFHRGEGAGKHAGEAAPVMDFDKAFKTACEAAGIPYGRATGHTFHCFRRTLARNARNAHIPENVIMAMTGHKTRSMFDRYSITDQQDTRDAQTALQAHLAAQPTATNVVALKKGATG
jgi:integrase